MKNTIIILNGPPGCGKDTLAEWIAKMGYEHLAFKDAMFDLIFKLTDITPEEWFERYNDRDLKEKPWSRINGMTCRELMIHLSEKVVKPMLGEDYFGKKAASKIEKGKDYVFSDGGFTHELKRLATETKETHEVVIVRIFRPGCDFNSDSRGYVYESDGEFRFLRYRDHGVIQQRFGLRGFGLVNYENRLLANVQQIMTLVTEGYDEGSL